MYSVILAAALTSGAEAPDWGHFRAHVSFGHGCAGWCHGCYGGGWCHGCYNAFSGCHGCFSCHSCYSSCYCSGFCSGCYCSGFCSGCYCNGFCSGCYCSGFSGYSCWSSCYCYSSCHCSSFCHTPVVIVDCSHCAGPVVNRRPPPPPGGNGGQGNQAMEKRVEKLEDAIRDMTRLLRSLAKKQEGTSNDRNPSRNETTRETPVSARPAPARVTVRLPADATLYVDGVVCPLTSGTRSFNTPNLQPGKRYFYTLRMDVTRDGETQSESRRVEVGSGQNVQVDFNRPQPVSTVSR